MPIIVNCYCIDTDVSTNFSPNNKQIKNQICGETRYILKETELIFKMIDPASGENLNLKNFLVETIIFY